MSPEHRAVLAASSGHPLYDVLLALHAVSALAGFGAVAISGAYGALARRPAGSEGEEETRRYFASPGRAEYLLLAVPFLGAAALAARPGGHPFGALWVVAAEVIWLAASGLLLGVVRPAEGRLRAGSDPPAGRRLAWAAGGCDLLFVVALLLMVTQPT